MKCPKIPQKIAPCHGLPSRLSGGPAELVEVLNRGHGARRQVPQGRDRRPWRRGSARGAPDARRTPTTLRDDRRGAGRRPLPAYHKVGADRDARTSLSIGALSDVASDDADAGEMKTMPGLTADTDGDDDAANKNKTLCDTITKTNRVRHGHGALRDHQVRADHQGPHTQRAKATRPRTTPRSSAPADPGPSRDPLGNKERVTNALLTC